MSATWMEQSRQGRVVKCLVGGGFRVQLADGSTVDAVRSRPMREHGVGVEVGHAALLRPSDSGSWEIVRRLTIEGDRHVPLLIPAVDPAVEYLLEPGQDHWLHPYKPLMYDWYDDYDDDLPMWRHLASKEDGAVLELACGTGRIVIDLARAGFTVTGVDFSQPFLDRAAEKLAAEEEAARRRVDWVHADMARWSDVRRFKLGYIACNGLHYMGTTSRDESGDARRRSIGTLYEHLAPGGLGVISNIAPQVRDRPSAVKPSPYLMLDHYGLNPNTGRWTGSYSGRWVDVTTGQQYDGPWRFVEFLDDGTRRAFEFDTPPSAPDEIRIPERPPAMTRDETAAAMRSAGFEAIELRAPPDLAPIEDTDAVVVFLGRKPGG